MEIKHEIEQKAADHAKQLSATELLTGEQKPIIDDNLKDGSIVGLDGDPNKELEDDAGDIIE